MTNDSEMLTANDVASDRLGWLERPGDDFPYYNDRPVGLTAPQWIFVLLAAAVSFLVLIFGASVFRGSVARFVPVVLYLAIPLVTLNLVSQGNWTALFRRVGWRDVRLMIGFAAFNLLLTLVLGSILVSTTQTTGNSTVASVGRQDVATIVLTYLRAAVQLLGEELMTILPFLALLYLFANRAKTGRVKAIGLAWLLTAVLFAAEHLPTYGWNVAQVLGGVGIVRLVLTLPYIMTKNVWVSTGAHVLNDWAMFSLSVLAGMRGSAG